MHLRALPGTWTCRPRLFLSRHQARKQGRGQPGLLANTAHVPPPLLPLPSLHPPFTYVHHSPLQPPSHKPKTIAGPPVGCSHCGARRPPCSGKTYCKQSTSADGALLAPHTASLPLAAPAFSLFSSLNKVLLHPSLRSLLFLSSPKPLPTSPATKPHLKSPSTGCKRGYKASLSKYGPNNNNTDQNRTASRT